MNPIEHLSDLQIVQQFLLGNLNLNENALYNGVEQHDMSAYANRILDALLNTPLEVFPQILMSLSIKVKLSTADILQFSNMETAMYYIPKLLVDKDNCLTYRELGMMIHPCVSNMAAAKYGENHAKLTVAIALASTTKKNGCAAITRSILTVPFCALSQVNKNEVLQRLCFKIPLVQEIVKCEDWKAALDEKLSFLSDSMVKRRKHCCVDIISFALNE